MVHVQPEPRAGNGCKARSNQSSVFVLLLKLYPDRTIFLMINFAGCFFSLQLCPKRGRAGSHMFFIALALIAARGIFFNCKK